MGYTHYWTFNRPEIKKGATEKADKTYKRALIECQRIAKRYNHEMHANGETWNRLSGFTAHTKLGAYGGIQLNGKQDLAHESFNMREHFRQALELGFDFCKTAAKPYDVVVTACLAVLKYRMGDLVEISSDGLTDDWIEGVELARRILRRKISNPIALVEEDRKRA